MKQIRSTAGALTVIALGMTFVAGCATHPTALTTDVEVRTEQTTYEIPTGSSSLRVVTTVRNNSPKTLLLDGLGRDFLRLEKRVDGAWRLAYAPVYIMPLVPDIELPPGETWELPISLYVGNEPNTFPKFEYDIPGRYRAVFGFRFSESESRTVYSNDFELRPAQ